MYRAALTSLALLGCVFAHAQWTNVQKLGQGGETFVSTDNKGSVYATSHEPGKLYVSKDYGKTFAANFDLPDSMCDVCSAVGADGRLYVIYIRPNVSGMQVMLSADGGKTLDRGGMLAGPFDREWIIVNPSNGEIGFNYSNGYIGGPKSKGIFYAASSDQGKTFKEISRIDKEAEGSYAVDPYLAVGTGGRIYAAWATSTDYNLIDKYKFASSDDGGRTWTNHAEIASAHPAFGDTQERWMLGNLVAAGKDTVLMFYEDYLSLTVDGQQVKPLLVFYRVSTDGGATWSSSKTCLSPKEIDQALHDFVKNNGKSSVVPTYVQTLPWAVSDPNGNIHMAFVDNRSGARQAGTKQLGLWQVRYAEMMDPKKGFGPSERVSHDWAANRPPLDFISCCADAKNVWITWTENPERAGGWDFSGDFYIARKGPGN